MIRQTSAAANKKKCEWEIRLVCPIRISFCRALHLQPSNQKFARYYPMWDTFVMYHISRLLTSNQVAGILPSVASATF